MLKRLLALVSCVALSLFAQDDAIVEMEEFSVDSGLQEDRPVDLPLPRRGGGTISSNLLNTLNITEPGELAIAVPGAYAQSNFGNATTFEVRGDPVETYLNGQRRAPNLFGWQPTFHGVAQVDVLRGPSPVGYGPGFYAGGYADYQTQRPEAGTRVTLELGAWAPDEESWAAVRFRLTHSIQLTDTADFLISYEGQENETFYEDSGGRDDHQDLYLALTWQSGHWDFFLNGQILWQAKPQTLGVNRPTQALVDGGTYAPGDLLNSSGAPLNPATDLLFGATIDAEEPMELARDATLLSPGDFSNAVVGHLQLLGTGRLANGVAVETKTLFEGVDRRRYHEFEYAEYVEQFIFDQQINLTWEEPFAIGGEFRTGLHLRRQDVTAFVSYFNEFFFAFDLTEPGPYNARDQFPAAVFPGQKGPGGREFFGVAAGTPESSDSGLWSGGLWLEHEIAFSEKLSLTYGLRGDLYHAEAEDSLGSGIRDEDTFTNGSANLTLSWRVSSWLLPYAAISRTSSVNGSLTGGSLLLYPDGLDESDYENRADLIEVGGAFSFWNSRASGSVAAFRQVRQRQTLQGGKADIEVEGVELQTFFSPFDGTDLMLNAAYVDGHYDEAAPAELGGSFVRDFFPGGAGYTLVGNLPPADYALPGLAQWHVSGALSQDWPGDLRSQLWGFWKEEAPGNLAYEFTIPAHFELNASLAWAVPFELAGQWTLTATVRNLTNEDNFLHNGGTFLSNQLVGRNLPRRFLLRLDGIF